MKESVGRTRSERVLDRYLRGVEPLLVKKAKAEDSKPREVVTPNEAFEKLKTHLKDDRKFSKSVSLLARLIAESSDKLPVDELVAVLRTIAEHPSVHTHARSDSAKILRTVLTRVAETGFEVNSDDVSLWTLLFTKINQVFTDDSLVFSARMKDLVQEMGRMKAEGRTDRWWKSVANGLVAISTQMQSVWSRVPLSQAVDFCVQNLPLFTEEDRGKITDLATSLQREKLTRVRERTEAIRGPLEAGHTVADGREEMSVVNGVDAWSTKQSGLSQ